MYEEQVRELCRQYLEEGLGDLDYANELVRIMYIAQDKCELMKWMSNQLLHAKL